MTKVVGVRFKDTGKTYYFDPKGLEIKKGDLVVVETARGMECGVAQYAPKEVAENEVTAPLKPVLRIATARDKQILEENKEKLHELAAFLLERETITGEEFMRLLNSEADVIETSATVVKEGEADAEEASSI